MREPILRAAILSTIVVCQPAFSDEVSDLKAEIAAQKQAAEAQRLRLDALEQKLNATQAAQTPQSQSSPAASGRTAPPAGQSTFGYAPGRDEPSGFAGAIDGGGLKYQSPDLTVGVYGLIDATLGATNHAKTGGGNKVGFDASANNAPWFSGARWGITGSRRFSDQDFSIIFKLEDEYLIKDGSADDNTAAFGRDAWVGIQSDTIGKLTFGRQNTLARDFSQNYGDPYGSSNVRLEEGGWTNSNNFKQLIFYAGSATGTRYDSGIVWKKPFSNGLMVGLGYQFGEIPGTVSQGSTQAVALAYNGGPFNISGFINHANVAGLTNASESIGGNYQFGIVRINAGYFHYTAKQGALGDRTDNAWTLSTKISPPGKMDYEVGLQTMKANNAAYGSNGAVLSAFGDATAATATGSGNRNTLYLSTFYHLDKSTEVYIAADFMRLTGGYTVASTFGFKSQTEFGTGIRLRF